MAAGVLTVNIVAHSSTPKFCILFSTLQFTSHFPIYPTSPTGLSQRQLVLIPIVQGKAWSSWWCQGRALTKHPGLLPLSQALAPRPGCSPIKLEPVDVESPRQSALQLGWKPLPPVHLRAQ